MAIPENTVVADGEQPLSPAALFAQADPANTDWFALACSILAPGTRHYNTQAFAIDWDSFDKLAAHGWAYEAWWLDPATSKRVEPFTPGAHLHEHRKRRLSDGSEAICYPPHTERPSLMLCEHCIGRGWNLRTDEDGDPAQVECRECHAEGRVVRPFSASMQLLEDLGVKAGSSSW